MGFSIAAAMQKHEALRFDERPFRLLQRLAGRWLWLVAMAVDIGSWAAQASALALAPVAVAVPLMGLGMAVLVAIGVIVLGERFTAVEALAIGLTVAGATGAAVASARLPVARAPLSSWVQVAMGTVAVAASLAIARIRTGTGYGLAAGILYAASATFTKEVGDRFATQGWSAVPALLRTPTPWLLIVLGLIALAFVMSGLRRANAASVVAIMSAVESAGLVLAGFLLYHERYPTHGAGILLGASLVISVLGIVLVAGQSSRLDSPDRGPLGREG
jgi:drug/metabolite transporter (DMT)-like permease